MPSAKPTNRPRVVVTGLGVLTSNAGNVPEFIASLRGGVSGIKPIRCFDAKSYCNNSAGVIYDLHPEDYGVEEDRDRTEQMLMIAAEQAVRDSEIEFDYALGLRSAVTLGSSIGGWNAYIETLKLEHLENPATRFDGPYPCMEDIPPCRLAAKLCDRFGIMGGTVSTVTACAAGANSIACGIDMIRLGRCDVVLAAAVDPLCELSFSGFNILMAMTSSSSRPFDRNRDGLLVGEGSGALVLEELKHALARNAKIYCEIPGYGLSNDAYHATQPDPEAGGACRAISRALFDADVSPRQINYINAHGTSTKYNDLMELKAIQKIYGKDAYGIPISSIKSMIGHTLGAAGTIEAVATVLALHHRFLPPTINFSDAIEGFDYDFVPQSRATEQANLMSSHSFGFGGSSACILFREAPALASTEQLVFAEAAF
ncbi:MAG: beta-ketoacyl-[acyl-carrier-protein] synthase family protein [Candidatus Sulfotelmatobacter sp.]